MPIPRHIKKLGSARARFVHHLDGRAQTRRHELPPGDEVLRFLSPDDARSTIENTEQGAATSAWCASSLQLDGMGGVHCEDVDIAEAVTAEATGVLGVRPWATDPALPERLWTLSEEWSGTRFG